MLAVIPKLNQLNPSLNCMTLITRHYNTARELAVSSVQASSRVEPAGIASEMVSKENKPAVVAGSGFLVLLFGIFMAWYGFPKILNSKINEGISLEDNGQGYKMWKVFPIPLTFKVYIFQVENPDAVMQGANPIVREKGPYIYDEYRRKEKVVSHEDTDTIEYVLKKTFFFNQEASGCYSVEDEVTVLNPALVGTALTVEAMFPSALGTISEAVPFLFPGIKNIFMKVKVKDFLFDGILLDCSSPDVEFVCTAIKGTAPETIRMHPNNRDFLFSLFHHLNDTDEGPYTMGRGIHNTSRGELLSFKGSSSIGEMWHGPTCNMLNGTDSTMYAPMKEPAERIYAFSSDICRSVYLEFARKSEVAGIPTYRYHITESVFDIREENDCFCPRGKDTNFNTIVVCPPRGTMNLMPCMQAPSIFSHPHFYMGDRTLVNYVQGLHPEEEKHRMFAEIEPLTGTPIQGWKRAQMNLNLKQLEDFELLQNVSTGLMPMIWLEEGAELPDSLLDQIRMAHTAIFAVEIIKWLIIAIGLIVLIAGLLLFFKKDRVMCFAETRVASFTEPTQHRREDKPSISNSDNNFNSTLMYPSLYPQLVNRNVNISVKKFSDDRYLL